MNILIVGQNSFLAQCFINTCRENGICFQTCSHKDIPENFSNFNWVVNFTINPKFFTEKYSESIDQDAIIARKISHFHNLKYAMISSRMVYGRNKLLVPASEWHKVELINNSIYGRNKIFSEQYCKSILDSNNLLIVRGSNIFGYEIGRNSFTGSVLNQLSIRSEILLDISKKTVRDFLPVNYFSSYLTQLILKEYIGIFNISSGIGITIEEFCNAIIEGYGRGVILSSSGLVVNDQSTLNNLKLLRIANYKISKSDIIEHAVNIGKLLKIKVKDRKDND